VESPNGYTAGLDLGDDPSSAGLRVEFWVMQEAANEAGGLILANG
jgi:hypothetical protein